LTLPQGSINKDAGRVERDIDRMPFDPTAWFHGVVTDFQQSRGEAYRAGQRKRQASQLEDYLHYFTSDPPDA
jgi:hypothetical protein